MINDIEQIQEGIKFEYGIDSKHLESVPVVERFQGKTVWDGVVEVFQVRHPKTERCFGWTQLVNTEVQVFEQVVVLGVPPVDTPKQAVQAFIANEIGG